MAFVKAVQRVLPSGNTASLYPFHISFEGLEKHIICRDDDDCDTLVKCIFVCAWKMDVIVIVHAVVSNHAHVAVLARKYEDALACGQEVKRRYSLLFRNKYAESKVLKGVDVNVQAVDTVWYLRNVLAYVPRNAFDNGADNLLDYKWTGFRAFFRDPDRKEPGRPVCKMKTRDWRDIFHTGDSLSKVPWLVNGNNELIPHSCCDVEYLESAFNHDQTFFFNKIGGLNVAEMTQKLIISPRVMQTDAEFVKDAEEVSQRWFNKTVSELSVTQKARLIPYVYHIFKTTVPQLARCFGMERTHIGELLHRDLHKVEL